MPLEKMQLKHGMIDMKNNFICLLSLILITTLVSIYSMSLKETEHKGEYFYYKNTEIYCKNLEPGIQYSITTNIDTNTLYFGIDSNGGKIIYDN